MHCTNCDYPLWNLKARQCPECGTPFLPSQFEFVANTVQFCCPHCEQPYYGTGEKGHLVPARFECIKCGREVHMDDMTVRPAPGITEEHTRPGVAPWLERRKRGAIRALLATVGMSLVKPAHLIRGVPDRAPVGEALVFACIVNLICVVVAVGVPLAGALIGFGGWAGGGGFSIAIMSTLWLYAIPALGLFAAFVFWPMITHLVLRLTGGSRCGLDRTFHALSYSAGANVLIAIPCFGIYVGWIWWIISACLMLRAGQRVHGGRATLAVLTLPLLIALVTGAAVLVVTIQMRSAMMGGYSVGGWGGPTMTTMTLGQAIESYGWQHASGGPVHVIELELAGMSSYVWSSTGGRPFCDPSSRTTPSDIPLGDVTLQDFQSMSVAQQLRAASDVIDAVPEDVIAYRFGDFIFTYPGVDTALQDPDLWLVVMLPDPDVNPAPQPDDAVYIAKCGFIVDQIRFGELAAALRKQNTHRVNNGLPALPDLTTITHDEPALPDETTGDTTDQEEEEGV